MCSRKYLAGQGNHVIRDAIVLVKLHMRNRVFSNSSGLYVERFRKLPPFSGSLAIQQSCVFKSLCGTGTN